MSEETISKRTAEEIGRYFDGEVEHFSNLSEGQASFVDSLLSMGLLARTANLLRPEARAILDIGCGAGNQTLNLLKVCRRPDCTLLDISTEMLKRARERLSQAETGSLTFLEGDLRTVPLQNSSFDLAVACAVLHHMRTDEDWLLAYRKIHSCLKPGGCLLVADLICYADPRIQQMQWLRYKKYLIERLGKQEAERMTESIQANDTPRPLDYQFAQMQKAGFSQIVLLHLNGLFATYYAVK